MLNGLPTILNIEYLRISGAFGDFEAIPQGPRILDMSATLGARLRLFQ